MAPPPNPLLVWRYPSSMTHKHHDSGYKELFSYPEFVQQLIEGFAPEEIARLMDFSTLKNHSGNYITPLFEEKFEDLVWSVEIRWQGMNHRVYLYLLLEFQSTIDHTMPIRLLHYLACFYDHLIKSKVTTAAKGLPPVLPIVLHNGSKRWTARQDIYELIRPEPPAILQIYQPHLRYYLVDESRYTNEELETKGSALSGIFGVENARPSQENLQQAVDRIVAIIKAEPDKERIDAIVTRWLKRHLQRLGAQLNLNELNSLMEDHNMLAENLENWREQLIREGLERGLEQGLERLEQTARNMITLTDMDDAMIAKITGLTVEEVAKLREASRH